MVYTSGDCLQWCAVYRGRQTRRRGGVPNWGRMHFTHTICPRVLVQSWILDSLFSTCEYLKLHASRETLSIACTHLLCVVGRYWCHSHNKTGQVWLAECLFKLGWWDLPVWFKDTDCWGFHITSIIMKQSEITTDRCLWCRSWKV